MSINFGITQGRIDGQLKGLSAGPTISETLYKELVKTDSRTVSHKSLYQIELRKCIRCFSTYFVQNCPRFINFKELRLLASLIRLSLIFLLKTILPYQCTFSYSEERYL